MESSCARRLKRTAESDSEDEVKKTVDNKTQASEKLLFAITFGNKFDSLNFYPPKFHANALAVYNRPSLNGKPLLDGYLELVPAFLYSLHLTLCKTDISLRRTLPVSAGPKDFLFSERVGGMYMFTITVKLVAL